MKKILAVVLLAVSALPVFAPPAAAMGPGLMHFHIYQRWRLQHCADLLAEKYRLEDLYASKGCYNTPQPNPQACTIIAQEIDAVMNELGRYDCYIPPQYV